jgi:L-histidine N-alpha-methyltransferase
VAKLDAMNPRVHIERCRVPDNASVSEARVVWDGLLSDPPTTDPKYFYDDRGSELFERITGLDEYYQTRTELALLDSIAGEIIEAVNPNEMVELGSGAGRKVSLLLDAIRDRGLLTSCILLDINETYLVSSAERLARDYPEMLVRGVVGDFTRDLQAVGVGLPRLFVFLAGTIGNLHPDVLPEFLKMVRRTMVSDDRFLVGLDLVKDRTRLEAAYNDSKGVTAEFNLNLLSVLNARFGTDFDPSSYEHVAFWDDVKQWIEMRLRVRNAQRVTMPGDPRSLDLRPGDAIRTEISCKYTRQSISDALMGTDLELERWWTDPDRLFALALVKPQLGVQGG